MYLIDLFCLKQHTFRIRPITVFISFTGTDMGAVPGVVCGKIKDGF